MNYSEEFKVFVSTIYGEAGNSSKRSWEVIAHSIRNRIGFGNWTGYSTIYAIVTETGFDAYTHNTNPYRNAMKKINNNDFSSDNTGRIVKEIIDTVLPIYEGRVKDDTNGVVFYWSPKAQRQLHRNKPRLYTTETPSWVEDNKKEIVSISGTENDDFQWLRFKRSKMFITIYDGQGLPLSDINVDIRFADGKRVPVLSNLKTNKEGQLPVFFARIEMGARFVVNGKYLKDKKGKNIRILPNNKDIIATIIVDTDNGFKSTLAKHEKLLNNSSRSNDTVTSVSVSMVSPKNDEIIRDSVPMDEVTFNIKLVEADTGKSLPDTVYYLEYKNNVKSHRTDNSGIDSDIKANICQSIGVYLDDDGGKKQSIYSMAFPVTGDLNGQTKVLKVPVVTFSVKFIDNNHKPISNYQFKTLYRGKQSAIKRANSQGVSTIKALAGQKLTLIDGQGRAKTTAIVTYGSKQWTIIIGTNINEKNISDALDTLSQEASSTPEISKPNDTSQPQTEQEPVIKIEKPKITEVEKDIEKGPTLEAALDEARITIKFVDEKTNKPLSGLSYITQSTKYGKNTSVTGKDGTRGRTHDSLVGVDITVLVYEDSKEVEKDVITASADRNDIPYVYKAKKPKTPSSKVLFNNVDRQSIVSQKSKLVIAELAEQCGMSNIYITSTLRTPEEQARAMWGKRSLYGQVGKAVHDVGSRYNKYGEARRTKEMAKAIRSYLAQGKRTSNHCVTFEIYAKLNVVDLGNNSNGFVYYKNKKKYLTTLGKKFKVACDEAKKSGKIKKYISGDGAEGAFHLEIPQ